MLASRPVVPAHVSAARRTLPVIGTSIDVACWGDALNTLMRWATQRESRAVCLCNVHSVVTARSDARFHATLASADMALPDGAPVAWLMRSLGRAQQKRIAGPDLMWQACAAAAERGQPIFLYGASPHTLNRLQRVLRERYPRLQIAGAISPPYRTLTTQEDEAVVDVINASGAGLVWVGLGCPKQEQWMVSHRGRIYATMVGVGAAFDYIAGTQQRAPLWMQRAGLEWLYRLASEPRRLWKRYLVTNSLFIVAALGQWLRHRSTTLPAPAAPSKSPVHVVPEPHEG